jgi:hypothetical protein
MQPTPRVFISYSRKDGEKFAKDLRQRLEAENISFWQDRVGMEGGRDWWLQIVEALDKVEFMVLVMTPKALESPIIRKEWRYARQKGVCVYPVKGVSDSKRGFLPKTAKFPTTSSKPLVSVRLGDKIDFENRPCWLGNLLNIHNIRN